MASADIACPGQVFPGIPVMYAGVAQHIERAAVSGRDMIEVVIVDQILRLHGGQFGQAWVKGQGRNSVFRPRRINQPQQVFLLLGSAGPRGRGVVCTRITGWRGGLGRRGVLVFFPGVAGILFNQMILPLLGGVGLSAFGSLLSLFPGAEAVGFGREYTCCPGR